MATPADCAKMTHNSQADGNNVLSQGRIKTELFVCSTSVVGIVSAHKSLKVQDKT